MEDTTLLKGQQQNHPMERCGIISNLFFCWLPPYLKKGFIKGITKEDMFATVTKQKSSYLSYKLGTAWKKEQEKSKPSLLRAIFFVFRFELLIYGIVNLFLELLRIAQPLLISKLITYFESNFSSSSKRYLYINACLLIFVTIIQVLTGHHLQLVVMELGMKIRVAVCALIYRKSMKLSKTALAETTVGQIVNLLSNDVGRFDFTCQHIHYLWLSPCATIICTMLLHQSVGFTGLIGSLTLLCFVPFQIYMAKLTSKYRLKTALCTDKRVRLMNEIISGIQVIKMYAWEKSFSTLIKFFRMNEMKVVNNNAVIKAITLTFNITLSRVATLICILVYVLSGNILTAAYAFTVASYYNYLRMLVTLQFPQAMTQFAESIVSIKRIQNFLLYEERYQLARIEENKPDLLDTHLSGVQIKDVSVKWTNSKIDNTLQNVTFQANNNQLVALIGPVGGGKSTLLQVILGELQPLEGSVTVRGTVSYASQEPWIFASSVKQNILFGEDYNEKKYVEVVKACALERDFSLFPNGDKTLIGERGSSLSGGQRARINLARAIYKEADIYLLDDPLSAVDINVGHHLLTKCIYGYLQKKCVILVTHQLHYLPDVKSIYLLESGKISANGSYDDLQNSNNTFINNINNEKEQLIKNKIFKTESQSSIHFEDYSKPVDQDSEEVQSGSLSNKVYQNYLKAGGSWFILVALGFTFVFTQVLITSCDLFLTQWVNVEQWRINNDYYSFKQSLENTTKKTDFIKEQFWSNFMNKFSPLWFYSSLIVVVFILAYIRSMASFKYLLGASSKIHNEMFVKIVNSPMVFFNKNPSGRILNRFSKDIGIIDDILPMKIIDSLGICLTVLAATIVIGIINPWILIPTFFILFLFYYIRKFFLASSRNIKRIEAKTRSPIFTHLAASMQGLTTIRAFKAEKLLTKEFDKFQDAYTSAYYMFLTTSRGFGFWLDFLCAIYISIVIASLIFFQSESSGGNVGLSLTQAITLSGMFQWVMREISEVENQMISVERTQQYLNLPAESDENTINPPKNWPKSGKIEFQNVSLKYSENTQVLKKISFTINAQEKVGIVGRTGAGKSSLIQALFRLSTIDGVILIDEVNTTTLSLKELRSKISIIPQEPVLFSGTLRKNLDPFDEYTDKVLWDALDEVELKPVVTDLPEGLYGKMAEGGANFSVGQRQLVCLARAIIRSNNILILDEATANVDPFTDGIIQNTIRKKFSDCTVLTIAHRLNTIMDSDKVLVMDNGKAVEFDHPYVLLQKNDVFNKLVRDTGSYTILESIATENFTNKL